MGLIITFADNAFIKSKEGNELERTKGFTKRVADMNKAAETLDRDDEFGELSLDPKVYAKKEGGTYGIPRVRAHVDDNRLFPHQILATKAFLRELRGFGLLADVVGSGKTYEACSVLSELAAKGKITTALLIVPSQVYNTWIHVLENQFGLGKDVLYTVGTSLDREKLLKCGQDGMFRPTRPLIVKTEDFVQWQEHDVNNVLFDVVLVDEAHNLCGEEGDSARAMKLLSVLMQTKKKAEKTYCILLSATPHSGNLENMFRLWYFIRCKGGNPSDFDEKDDSARTAEYNEEKKHYISRVCHGATTVMEFIESVRMEEVTVTHAREFTAFLKNNDVASIDAFRNLLTGEKKRLIKEFLRNKDNIKIRERVNEAIASAYHDGVLRSIMIRQPHNNLNKGKRIENIFFFPARNKGKMVTCNGLIPGKKIKVNVENLQAKDAIQTDDGTYSLPEYIREHQGNLSYRAAYAELFFNGGILEAMGLREEDFSKKRSLNFYWEELEMGRATNASGDENVGIQFRPMYGKETFDAKITELKEILRRHTGERVLIFFDYDISKSERCFAQVLEILQKDPEFAPRILVGDGSDRNKIEERFNQKEDTVLVVVDNAFTEGANLQKSRVIVNFQVTPNPLAMEQRICRIFRLCQENDVIIYSLADMRALEGYVLMYFTTIGLMTSNNGDAAIIAGSNNDNMVTIRCRACKRVQLLSRDEYEDIKKNHPEKLFCNEGGDICTQYDSRGTQMEEINSNEIKCTKCGALIKRESDNSYYCFTHTRSGRGILCSNGVKGDRQLYCRKICVIAHCEQFRTGRMKGKCEALAEYLKNPGISDSDLETLCNDCPHATLCPSSCRLVHGDGASAIDGCIGCNKSECTRPGPHVIDFDDNWHASCPRCGDGGILKPVVARTFETFIRSAFNYQQDGGESFCRNLLDETDKVALIQEILSNDKVRS